MKRRIYKCDFTQRLINIFRVVVLIGIGIILLPIIGLNILGIIIFLGYSYYVLVQILIMINSFTVCFEIDNRGIRVKGYILIEKNGYYEYSSLFHRVLMPFGSGRQFKSINIHNSSAERKIYIDKRTIGYAIYDIEMDLTRFWYSKNY